MKIIYCSTALIPSKTANSIHIMKMCNSMSKLGHNVILLIPWIYQKKSEFEYLKTYYGIKYNFKIVRIFCPKKIKGWKHIYGLFCLRYVLFQRPDLVYSRFLHGAYYFTRFGINTIFESHFPYQLYSRLERLLLRKMLNNQYLRKIVVISKALKKIFTNAYNNFPLDKMIVEHDAADDIINKNLNKNLSNEILNIAYIGSLYKGRGIELILEICSKIDFAYFHIIGGDEIEINQWKQLMNSKNLKFHGYLNQSEIHDLVNSIDVLVAPYQKSVSIYGSQQRNTADWMSPLKIFEYMSFGKVIIASDLPVLREVLNEKNSILVNPDDQKAWIEALNTVKDSRMRKKLAEKAYSDFHKFYTWDRRVDRILNQLLQE